MTTIHTSGGGIPCPPGGASPPEDPPPCPWEGVSERALEAFRRGESVPPLLSGALVAPYKRTSLLEACLKSLPFDPASFSQNIFALWHLDKEIKGSYWEGGNVLETILFVESALNDFPELQALLRKTREDLIITNLEFRVNRIIERLCALLPGEAYLMQGGWYGTPGHAMLYKFVRREDQNYDIYIINTGDGLEYHTGLCHEHKTRAAPVEVIKGVEPCLLGLGRTLEESNQGFIRRLVRFTLSPELGSTFSADDIYIKGFGVLDKRRESVLTTMDDFRTLQRSGSCTATVLKAWVYFEMRDAGGGVYNRWKINLDFFTLLYWAQKTKLDWSVIAKPAQKFESRDELRYCLLCAAQDLLRSVTKQSHFLTYEPLVQIKATLTDLIVTISDVESRLVSVKVEGLKPFGVAKPTQVFPVAAILAEARRFKTPLEAATPLRPPLPLARVEKIPSSSRDFHESFQAIHAHLTELEAASGRGSRVCKIAVERWVEKLPPMTSRFWASIPKGDLRPVSTLLIGLLEKYTIYASTPSSLHAHEHNCALHLFCALHFLLLRLDQEVGRHFLRGYGIDISTFHEQMRDRLFLLYNSQDLTKRRQLLTYLTTQNAGKQLLCRFSRGFEYKTLQKLEYIQRIPDYRLLNQIVKMVTGDVQGEIERIVREKHRDASDVQEQVTVAAVLLAEGLAVLERDPVAWPVVQLMKGALFVQMFGTYLCGDSPEVLDPPAPPQLQITSHYNAFGKTWEIQHSYPPVLGPLEYSYRDYLDRSAFLPLHRRELEVKSNSNGYVTPVIIEALQKYPLERTLRDLDSEGSVLALFSWAHASTIPFDRLLARTQSRPFFQTALLLFYLQHNFMLLMQSDEMTLLELMLFKPIYSGDTWSIPLFEELRRSLPLRRQLQEFTERGLSLLADKQSRDGFNPYACLFFVRLHARIQAAFPSVDFGFDPFPRLDQWLRLPDLPFEAIGALHLHRIIAFSVRPDKRFTPGELESILISWIVSNQYPPSPKWKESDLEVRAYRFVWDLEPQFQAFLRENPARLSPLCNTALRLAGLADLGDEVSWAMTKFPYVRVNLGPNRWWQLNLSHAQIDSEAGLLSVGDYTDVVASQSYKEVFGDAQFLFRKLGPFFVFQHPRYGEVRMRLAADTLYGIPYWLIYRRSNDAWFQYIPEESQPAQELRKLPLPILAQHTCWVETTKDTVLIDPLEVGAPSYQLVGNQLFVVDGGTRVEEVKCLGGHSFTAFETKPLCVYETTSLSSGIEKVKLDRYRGVDGSLLAFTRRGDVLEWDVNPSFVIANDQMSGSLGCNFNYLLLRHKENENLCKFLIPVQRLRTSQALATPLTHYQTLDVQDQDRKATEYRRVSKYKCLQRGCYDYFEYNISGLDKGGVITPLHLEGRLFLAYFFLTQRAYDKAQTLLREAFPTAVYSPKGVELISWILHATMHADHSASNVAIRLQAGLLFERLQGLSSFLPESKITDIRQAIGQAVRVYLDLIESVPARFRLSPHDELTLVEKHQPDSPRFLKLTKGTYPPPALIPKKVVEDRYLLFSPYSKAILIPGDTTTEYLLACLKGVSLNPEMRENPWNIREEARIGACFSFFYNKAIQCKTAEEAVRLAVDLDCFLGNAPGKPGGLTSPASRDACLQGLIHFALRSKLAPPLPPRGPELSDKVKTDWWGGVLKAYVKAAESPQDRFFGTTDPVIAPLPRAPLTLPLSSPPLKRPIYRLLEEVQRGREAVVVAQPPPLLTKVWTHELIGPYFDVSSPESRSTFRTTLEFEIDRLEAQWQPYEDSIREEKRVFEADLQEAALRRQTKKAYTLKVEGRSKLTDILQAKDMSYAQDLRSLETIILEIAHAPPSDPSLRSLREILERGDVFELLTFNDLINLWLLGDVNAYQTRNPYIPQADLGRLDQLLTAYLDLATNQQQVRRALHVLGQLERSPDDVTSLGQLLGETLAAEEQLLRGEQPLFHRAFRVLEFRANIRARPQQVELVQRLLGTPGSLRYNHAIFQMIMGGGKTSVLATMLLYMGAQEGKLSVFIAPTAQFETLNSTLTASLHHCFGMPVRSINITREEMRQLANLKAILRTLQETRALKGALLLGPQVAQYLQLECFCLLSAEEGTIEPNLDRCERIATILEILHVLRTESSVHFDEVDVLLNLSLEVNFPLDPPKHLDQKTIDWLCKIFECMTDSSLLVPGIDGTRSTLAQEFNLRSPTRRFNLSRFRDVLRPRLAQALVDKYGASELLLTTEAEKNAFVSYVTGSMNDASLTDPETAFLNLLREARSPEIPPARKTQATLIALTKYLLTVVLESTLARQLGLHYGRVGSCQVVPYEGVDAPTSNRFGNPFEAACFYLLTALAEGGKLDRGIHPDQLRKVIQQYLRTAEAHAEMDRVSLDDTPEGIECIELTGIPLSQVLGRIDEAIKYVRGSISRILRVEAISMASSIDFFPHFFGSNSFNLVGLFSTGEASGSSIRGMSGTPWNLRGYAPFLQQDALLDVGVEGSIAHVFLEKSQGKPNWIHVVDQWSVETILNQAQARDNSRHVHCILDAAGCFKDTDTATVARETLTYFKEDRRIDTVLYFGRRTPGGRPDCFMALKKGVTEPIVIGSTLASVLVEKGIDINTCFTLYDHRHCEATDIPQPSQARALLLFNEHTDRRTFFQAVMRMRHFFKGQCVDVVVQTESRALLVNGAQHPQDILSSALIRQAASMSRDVVRAARYDISDIPRAMMVKALLKERQLFNGKELVVATRLNLLARFRSAKPYLLTVTDMDPLQWVELEREIPTVESLQAHARAVMVQSQGMFDQDSLERRTIDEKAHEAVRSRYRASYLPKMVPMTASSFSLGREVHVEMQQEVEVETNTELFQEVARELSRYTALPVREVKQEIDWKRADFVVSNFPRGISEDLGVCTLEEVLERCLYPYEKPYGQIFQGVQIFASRNWVLTTEEQLPIFHSVQKPAHQILVMVGEDHNLRFMLLSMQEAEFFVKLEHWNKWVIFPNGAELSSHAHQALTPEQQIQLERTLVYIHILNGNVALLQKDRSATAFVLGNPLAIRFLMLKVEGDPVQKNLFYLSSFAGSAQRKMFICEARRQQNALRTQALKDLQSQDVDKVDLKDVSLLPGPQVQHLRSKERLALLDRVQQVPWVVPAQVDLLPEILLQHLNKTEQIDAISMDKLICLIENPSRYQLLSLARVAQLALKPADAAQIIPQLSREQIPFIPPPLSVYVTLESIDQLVPEQIVYLCTISAGAEGHLSVDRVHRLTGQAQIAALSDGALEHLSPGQVALFPASHVFQLPQTQIMHLRGPEQIQAVRGAQVPLLTAYQEQVPHLVREQLQEVTPDQVPFLLPALVPDLPNPMLQYVRGVAQIQAVPVDRVRYLTAYAEQAPHLSVEQIGGALDGHIPYLTNPLAIQAVTPGQVRFLTQRTQLIHLNVAQTPYIDQVQALEIPANLLHLVPVEVLPDGRIHEMEPQGVLRLQDRKLEFLRGIPQIQAVPVGRVLHLMSFEEQVPHLSDLQLQGISSLQVFHLPAERLHLVPEQVFEGISLEDIREFPVASVPYLPNSVLPRLSQAQLQSLTADQVRVLSAVPDRPQGTLQEFVRALHTDAQIAALPDPLLEHLDPITQLTLIPPGRVTDLPHQMLQFLNDDIHDVRLQAVPEGLQEHLIGEGQLDRWRRLRAPPPRAAPLLPPQPAPIAPQPRALAVPALGGDPLPVQRAPDHLPPQAYLAGPAPPPVEQSSFQKIWEDWFAIQARNEPIAQTARKILAWTGVVFTAGLLLFAILAIATIYDAFKRRHIQRTARPRRAHPIPQRAPSLVA